jgi:hypothetical protein
VTLIASLQVYSTHVNLSSYLTLAKFSTNIVHICPAACKGCNDCLYSFQPQLPYDPRSCKAPIKRGTILHRQRQLRAQHIPSSMAWPELLALFTNN